MIETTRFSETQYKNIEEGNMGINNLEVKKKFCDDTIVLLKHGVREIKISNDIEAKMLIDLLTTESMRMKNMTKYYAHLVTLPDYDPRL